ncbi:MAG: membrane integrity-associated transporter subunit PqiC [Aquabacterium sp.]|jgi:uncharacterized lipoprotein YmbA
MTRHLTLIGTAMAAAMLTGCGSAPTGPTVWLALPAVTATAAQASAPSSAERHARQAPTVVVQRLRVPEYLQTTALRYRDGEHSFAEWPQARWAERVEVNLTRHLTQSLQAQRPAWRWCEAPCSQAGAGSVQVSYQSLEIQRAAREVVAVVQWQLNLPGHDAGPPMSWQGVWQHRQVIEGDAPQAQVAALAALNTALSQALVQAWDQATQAAPLTTPLKAAPKAAPSTPPEPAALTPTSAPTPSPGA